jgi:hypothetical protein
MKRVVMNKRYQYVDDSAIFVSGKNKTETENVLNQRPETS